MTAGKEEIGKNHNRKLSLGITATKLFEAASRVLEDDCNDYDDDDDDGSYDEYSATPTTAASQSMSPNPSKILSNSPSTRTTQSMSPSASTRPSSSPSTSTNPTASPTWRIIGLFWCLLLDDR